ncbi:hypothetical protein HYX16_03560 [Candidatus Woesearchaeota archaeon]|nr:hypothetical protein [Candidatus Woesearchaeota archaeon]
MKFKKSLLTLIGSFFIGLCASNVYALPEKDKNNQDTKKEAVKEEKKEEDKKKDLIVFEKPTLYPCLLEEFVENFSNRFNERIEERVKKDLEPSFIKEFVYSYDRDSYNMFIRDGLQGNPGKEEEREFSDNLYRELKGVYSRAISETLKDTPAYKEIRNYFSIHTVGERINPKLVRGASVIGEEDEMVLNPQKYERKYFWEEVVNKYDKFNVGANIRLNKDNFAIEPRVSWANFYTVSYNTQKRTLAHKITIHHRKRYGLSLFFSSKDGFQKEKQFSTVFSYVLSPNSIIRLSGNYDFEGDEKAIFLSFFTSF